MERPSPEFKVPLELLKTFQRDPRFLPAQLPVAGYIIFDREMLKSILLSNDVEARKSLAKQLDSLNHAGGELVIMAR
jgi:hypothetical protein